MNNRTTTRDVASARTRTFEIYPKRYFDLSPTWFAWTKLTAADIYSLRRERGFEGQNILFHLNYPIRYVDVVGIVVSIELVGAGRYTILQLDDSSGLLIEVKIALTLGGQDGLAAPVSMGENNTGVQNLKVTVLMGTARVIVSDIAVEVGRLLRVKGEMDDFRQIRQILPKRVWVVKNTTEEVQFWSKMEAFKRHVLSCPWTLDQQQRMMADEAVLKKEAGEAKRRRKLERARREREARDHSRNDGHQLVRKTKDKQKKTRREAPLSDIEAADAEDMDKGALEGSNIIRRPWD